MEVTESRLRDPAVTASPRSQDLGRRSRPRRSAAARACATALVAALSGAVAGAIVVHHGRAKAAAPPPASLPHFPTPDVAGIVAAVAPAVVSIRTRPANIGLLFDADADDGVGTGIVVGSSGTIVTSATLVASARPITVTLGDGRSLPAIVLGKDPVSGIAVLKVNARDLPVARLAGSSRLRVGDDVVALGDALALPGGPTVTRGVVSALQRSVTMPKNSEPARLTGLLEVTTALGPANAGGPVVDTTGEVVGVATTASNGGRAPGFAVDVVQARPEIDALEHGVAPTDALGAHAIDVTPRLARDYGLPVESGALIASVEPKSPAGDAGLRPDDIVVEFAHQRIATAEDLARSVRDPSVTSVRLSLLRGHQTLTLTVRLRQ